MLWNFNEELLKRKQDLINNGYKAYCLFTLQGIELNIAEELNATYDYLLATPITKMSHRSYNSRKYDVQEVLLGGYIFVYIAKDKDINKVRSVKNYFKILNVKNDNGQLYGNDLKYANWVLDKNGVISVSEAINLNGKVKILNGPLKSLEGYIVKYSKHNRNCQIEINFLNQKISTWLPFEWVDIDMTDFKEQIR